MKIVSFQKPGGPEVLEISESEIPALRKNEILIEVYATACRCVADSGSRSFWRRP
jgi:NADPH:quinone reductase-like Zn-dependent oxidoreductase